MTASNSDPDNGWRNVEIRIIYPMPVDDYELTRDRRFDELADTVNDLFPQAVMSGQVVWSDTDETG